MVQKTRLNYEEINQLHMMQMSINAIRDDLNMQLSAISAQIESLLPEPPPIDKKRDWRSEIRKACKQD
jgi:hypothetical protein